jgi:hypothetical protein
MTATTAPERATRGQLTVLNAGLTEHGAKQRAHRVAIVAGLAGRPNLESTKDLTRAEASSILRHLDHLEQVDEMRDLVEQYRPA